MQLSTWDKEELDDKLANRVQVSKRAVAKIVQVFDRLMQRNEKITFALKEEEITGIIPINFHKKIFAVIFSKLFGIIDNF